MTKLETKQASESAMSCHSQKSTVRTSNLHSAKSDSGHGSTFNDSPKGSEEGCIAYTDIMMERYMKQIEILP